MCARSSLMCARSSLLCARLSLLCARSSLMCEGLLLIILICARSDIVNVRTFIVLGYFVLATLSLVRLLVKASLVKLARYRIGREPVVRKLDSAIHRVMIFSTAAERHKKQ